MLAIPTNYPETGENVEGLYVLETGWVTSNYDMKDGTRQIVKVHLPGDILGAPSLSLKSAGETLASVTAVTFRIFPLGALTTLFRDYPRISASLFLCAQQERVLLMERLGSVGRQKAVSRLAALLLDLAERLNLSMIEPTVSFELPLVQQELAEMLGITAVHLNRTFRQLLVNGLVRRKGRQILLTDISSLRKLAGLRVRAWGDLPAWVEALPQTR